MSEELHPARHIYLYAKLLYQRGDMLQDMKVLVGDYTAVPPEYVSVNSIFMVVCDIALPHLVSEGNVEYRLREFLVDLIRVSQHHKRPLTIEDVVDRLLSVLRGVRVRDAEGNILINLGEPDYNILPRPKE